jgi:hypothetical protein
MKSAICSFCSSESDRLFFGAHDSKIAICAACVTGMYFNLITTGRRSFFDSEPLASETDASQFQPGSDKLLAGQKFKSRILAPRSGGYAISLPNREETGFLVTEMDFLVGASVDVVYCMNQGDHLFAVDYQSFRKTEPR